jgi:rod shape-determining protein MreD
MMLRAALFAALMAAAVVVNGAWLSRLPVPAAPDLVLLVVLAAATRRGVVTGALMGTAAGYLRDLVGGSPLGLFTLSYLAVGAAAGAAMTMIDLRQRRMPAVAAALGTALLYAISGLVVTLTGLANLHWTVVAVDAGGSAVLNAVLARPVDTLVGWADRLPARRYAARVIGFRVLR